MNKRVIPKSVDQYVDEILLGYTKIKPVSFECCIVETTSKEWRAEELLGKFVDRGFILHGQPPKSDKLIPRKGNGQTVKDRLTAVYATNIPAIAILHAITDIYKLAKQGKFIEIGWSVKCDKNDNPEQISFRSSHDMENNMTDGYVYVCDRSCFKKIDATHFICLDEYVPRIRIPVTEKDFKHAIEIDMSGDCQLERI